MFVQFIALCYYEYLGDAIRKMKSELGGQNSNPKHNTKDNLGKELKLKRWLDNTPVYLILQWFDTIENVKVSIKLSSMRWTTKITSRDPMLLDKLDVIT